MELRRVRSICFLSLEVAVRGKGGCDIDKYDYGILNVRVAYSETSI